MVYKLHFFGFRGNETSPHQIVTKDCINGTWFPKRHFEEMTNYSTLIKEFGKAREIKANREQRIHYEADLIIYNRTK